MPCGRVKSEEDRRLRLSEKTVTIRVDVHESEIERLIVMSATKKKPPVMKTKPKDAINKKALAWIVLAFAIIVVLMAVLIVLNQ